MTNLLANKSLTVCFAEGSLENSAKPSPCATAIGILLPAMPLKNNEGDSKISTMANLASNCSDWLRTKCGQCDAPGINSRRLLIIWQPLHTPKAKLSCRVKNAENSSRARALNKIDLAQPSPAPNTSP